MQRIQIIVIAILLVILLYYFSGKQIEQFFKQNDIQSTLSTDRNIKFKRCNTAGMSDIEQNILNRFQKVENESWDLFVPCGYTYVEKELQDNDFFRNKKNAVVLGMDGADNFAAKDRAWSLLQSKYGRLRATIFMPETWLTYNARDMELFQRHAAANPDDMYIMKKNIQQQQGLKIIKHPSETKNAFKENYVVVQRILRDPYLVNGRKINIRVYILVVCKEGKKDLYVYDDGFVYYSKVPYRNGVTWDEIVTSGYLSRDVYDQNPLTFRDLVRYIQVNNGAQAAENFVKQRNFVLSGFIEAIKDHFCGMSTGPVYAQSYGVDMQPNHDLSSIHLLEINKGQSLEIMDLRDGHLKQKMMDDIFRTLSISQDGIPSGFSKIWSS